VIDLTLGCFVTQGSLLRLVDSKREHEISFPPYAIHNKPTVGVVHHSTELVLVESLVGLFMIVWTVGDLTYEAMLKVIIVICLEAQRRIWNFDFDVYFSIAGLFDKLIWFLVPEAYRVVSLPKPDSSRQFLG